MSPRPTDLAANYHGPHYGIPVGRPAPLPPDTERAARRTTGEEPHSEMEKRIMSSIIIANAKSPCGAGVTVYRENLWCAFGSARTMRSTSACSTGSAGRRSAPQNASNELLYCVLDPDTNTWSTNYTTHQNSWGAPALAEIGGKLHMVFAANNSKREIVDLLYDDQSTDPNNAWHPTQPDPTSDQSAGGVAAAGLGHFGYMLFQSNDNNLGLCQRGVRRQERQPGAAVLAGGSRRRRGLAVDEGHPGHRQPQAQGALLPRNPRRGRL